MIEFNQISDWREKRLVLFGAGQSGKCFIEQNRDRHIVAVVDNNPKKQGSELLGVPIIAPNKIVDTECEVIVITSQWINGILTQLEELGLSDIPVIIPGKREMVGMRDSRVFSQYLLKKIASELAIFLNGLATDNNIDLYLDFGVLLGAIRDNDFIAWDNDLDFSVNDVQFDSFVELVSANRNKLPEYPDTAWDITVENSDNLDFALSITCYDDTVGEQRLTKLTADIGRRVVYGDRAIIPGRMPRFYAPQSHFSGFDLIQFLGTTFKAPHDAVSYLRFVYGDDWQTPKSDTTYADYYRTCAYEIPYEQYSVPVIRRL